MEGKTKASQAALACASEATRKLNPHLFQCNDPSCCSSDPVLDKVAAPLLIVKPKTRIRQDKPMNKLEQEAFDFLKSLTGKPRGMEVQNLLNFSHIRAQSKRFRLASGLWYKPDVTSIGNFCGEISDLCYTAEICWEVKGPHAFRGGFENLKMAATQYPEIRWILMWKDQGQWQFQEVLP